MLEPQVKPPPIAARRTMSPFLILLLIITVVAIAGCDSGWSIAGHEI